MNPVLMNMIMRPGESPYGHAGADPLPGRVALGVLAAIALLIAWLAYDAAQWRTDFRSNVTLRVARGDDASHFTPVLVDDRTGEAFADGIGGKSCRNGPVNLPAGSFVLAAVESQTSTRTGRKRHGLDTGDLARRYC